MAGTIIRRSGRKSQGRPLAFGLQGTGGMNQQQKRNLMMGAAGIGAVLLAQAWRRRSDYDFAGKSVVITGGSRGLGLVIARELADEGARLTLVARDAEELSRASEDIRTRQPFTEVLTVSGDVRQRYEAE